MLFVKDIYYLHKNTLIINNKKITRYIDIDIKNISKSFLELFADLENFMYMRNFDLFGRNLK